MDLLKLKTGVEIKSLNIIAPKLPIAMTMPTRLKRIA